MKGMIVKKIAQEISIKNRKKKYSYFLEMMKPSAHSKVLDVGFSNNDWYSGINFLEKNYPYQGQITALGIEDAIQFKEKYPLVKAVKYDGNLFPFKDQEFDIVWSNAVIEHVGNYEKQRLFLSELLRTSKQIFITTPNRFFPFEVHTRLPLLHFLPKKQFDKILKFLKKDWATGDYMNLLGENDIKRLFSDLGVSNYKIKRNRFFIFTMDLVIST